MSVKDALKLRLTAEHGAGALKAAVHRQRRRIEAPALERGQLSGIGLDLLLDEMEQRGLIGVE